MTHSIENSRGAGPSPVIHQLCRRGRRRSNQLIDSRCTASRPSLGRSSLVLVSPSCHDFGCRRETAVPPNCANETGALRSRQMSREFVSARKPSLLDSRKVPELTEEFTTQKSQKREIRQIFDSWRREWDSNPRYGFPHTRFPSVRLKPLGHPSGTVAMLAI